MEGRDLQPDEVVDDGEDARAPASAFLARQHDVVDPVRLDEFRVVVVLLVREPLDRFPVLRDAGLHLFRFSRKTVQIRNPREEAVQSGEVGLDIGLREEEAEENQ